MNKTLAVISLVALASTAQAEGPDYNYLEGNYQRIDIDDDFADVDGDGFAIAGSLEVAENWHIFASYGKADLDFGIDLDEASVGGGFHAALSPTTDIVANLAYVSVDADAFGGSFDDDGFGVALGVRSLLTEQFELAGFIEYVDRDDAGDDTTLSGEGWYRLTRNFALGGKIGLGDDVTTYGLGARLYFD